MSTLIYTYGLSYGNLVVAIARANNSIGYGAYSQANTAGVTILTSPT
jgi:hypothetical protein